MANNPWLLNSMRNLLPLSEEKSDFKKALKEWFFTGEIIDHEVPIEVCNLCEKDQLRYHYEIGNGINSKLWVGSKCIGKFDITVTDEQGNEVTENKEAYLLKQAKKRHIDSALEKLRSTGLKKKFMDYNVIDLDDYCHASYQSEGKLDPKMLNWLFKRLDEENISYDKKAFAITISLKSYDSKDKLRKLKTVQYERIKKSLSLQQRKFYLGN